MTARSSNYDPIVVTGIGLITSTGRDRETAWAAVRRGVSRVGWLRNLRGIPDNTMFGAEVPMGDLQGQLKTLALGDLAADEAVRDAAIDFTQVDRERFGCSLSGHMGDTRKFPFQGPSDENPGDHPWWHQFLPSTSCSRVASHYQLLGPRTCYSTACASSLICFQSAVRMIRDNQADIVMTGGADAIHPLFAAGFRRMGALAKHDDPALACRPFDSQRTGFVMGEGAAVLILERLSHALSRGVKIYAEVRGQHALAQAHHVTGLDTESEALVHLIHETLRRSEIEPEEVGYINAHGTGTTMNDLAEMIGIRSALGDAADQVRVSSTKSCLGHLVNAAGGVELALTALALRDGFAPPTINLTDPDPACTINCVPQIGQRAGLRHALKIAVAFGGHLVSVALSRWNAPATARPALDLDHVGQAVRRAA